MKTSSCRMLAAVLLAAVMIPGQLAGQNTPQPKKVLTPEQQERQEKFKSYLAQRKELQKRAAQAFDTESGRARAGNCKNAGNTRDIEECLEKESEITEKNYAVFAGAVRELLALASPESAQPTSPGPTGTPPSAEERTREFDSLQGAWEQYEKIGTAAAYGQYKGGSHAPVFSMEAKQNLVRLHMRELSFIYDDLLHH
jgi:hypothetical protein